MRDPNRIPEIIDALKIYWAKYPDQRLGQILENINRLTSDKYDLDIFYMEDNVILTGLEMLTKFNEGLDNKADL